MAALDDLNAAVIAVDTAVTNAVSDLQALETEVLALKTSGVDPAAVSAIAAKLSATAQNLQTAVTAAPA